MENTVRRKIYISKVNGSLVLEYRKEVYRGDERVFSEKQHLHTFQINGLEFLAGDIDGLTEEPIEIVISPKQK